jgi:hypothetical protein
MLAVVVWRILSNAGRCLLRFAERTTRVSCSDIGDGTCGGDEVKFVSVMEEFADLREG